MKDLAKRQFIPSKMRQKRLLRGIVVVGAFILLSFVLSAFWGNFTQSYAMTSDEKWGMSQTLSEIEAKAQRIKDDLAFLGYEQKAIVSAYNAEVEQTDSSPFTMANGRRVHDRAVANNCLSFGTKVIIEGEIYTVEDRMNRRYDCRYFDMFMWEKSDAIQWGRKTIDVVVLVDEV